MKGDLLSKQWRSGRRLKVRDDHMETQSKRLESSAIFLVLKWQATTIHFGIPTQIDISRVNIKIETARTEWKLILMMPCVNICHSYSVWESDRIVHCSYPATCQAPSYLTHQEKHVSEIEPNFTVNVILVVPKIVILFSCCPYACLCQNCDYISTSVFVCLSHISVQLPLLSRLRLSPTSEFSIRNW